MGNNTRSIQGTVVVVYCPARGHACRAQSRPAASIFLLLAIGALGLTLGPWLSSGPLQAGGLALHVIGTIWLLVSLARQLRQSRGAWTAGRLHIFAAYAWLLLVALLGPVVVFLPQSTLARNTAAQGSPLLIYGWLMQIIVAVLPYLCARAFTPQRPAVLGGSALTLVTANVGAVLYIGGLVRPGLGSVLHGLAFAAWALTMLPVGIRLWRSVQAGTENPALPPVNTGAVER